MIEYWVVLQTLPVMVAWPGLMASMRPVSSVTVAMPALDTVNLTAASNMGPPLLWICEGGEGGEEEKERVEGEERGRKGERGRKREERGREGERGRGGRKKEEESGKGDRGNIGEGE